MSTLHIRQIKKVLVERFVPHLDLSDLQGKPPQDDSRILSRALAALSLSSLTGDTEDNCAAAVVDGFDDNGIDAIYFDAAEPSLYLLQAKWFADGKGGVTASEMTKFVEGAKDVIAGRMDRFNEKTRAKSAQIQAVLERTDCTLRLVYAYTGSQPIGTHVKRVVDDFLAETNDISEIAHFKILTQSEIHAAAARQFDDRPIDLEIALTDWGHVDEPYRAFYGQVDAAQVANWWNTYGNRLFQKNLRKFLGDTAINAAITKSLMYEAANFWYYNNGITMLCSRVDKRLSGAADRRSGVFHCKGLSVVNGAQTVGAIGRTKQQSALPLGEAKVMVRLISLEDCPPDFGARVTKAANTQNRIEQHDFATLDPEQARIARELLLDDVTYVYKSGDAFPSRANGFTIEDATVALACAADDGKLAMYAKAFIGKLWDDSPQGSYRLLFHSGVSGRDLWDKVQLLRRVEETLDNVRQTENGLRRELAVHGNRFITRQVFRLYSRQKHATMDLAALTVAVLEYLNENFRNVLSDVHLAWTFKTQSKCARLEHQLFEPLNAISTILSEEGSVRLRLGSDRQLSLFANTEQ